MQYVDQLNSTILLASKPKRIVSLVPSQTEFLFDIGLEEEVVGITKFCIYPSHWLKTKTIIGGTKNVDIEKVRNLHPDLIIGNKEENTKEDIIALREIAPVWMSDIFTLEDALSMMDSVGNMVEKQEMTNTLVQSIRAQFESFQPKNTNKKVLYLIWRKPFIGVACNTFIDDMLSRCGFSNVLANETRYPILENIADFNPDVVFLSSEPYPFKEKHMQELQAFFPKATIKLVDGEMFSWYGSRLRESVKYFRVTSDEVTSRKLSGYV
jgi:ABC-type Fe3+-hydroxamate transport system substrate-binding protein